MQWNDEKEIISGKKKTHQIKRTYELSSLKMADGIFYRRTTIFQYYISIETEHHLNENTEEIDYILKK